MPDVRDEPAGHIAENSPAQSINGNENITSRDEKLDLLFDMVQGMARDREKERREWEDRLEGLSDMVHQLIRGHEEQKESDEQRLARREEDKDERDAKAYELHDMVTHLIANQEEEKMRHEEERAIEASRPGFAENLDEMRRHFAELMELVNMHTDSLRHANEEQMDTLMAQMKSSTTSNVASPNVTHYLAQFTKVLSGEIRTLLVEVGSLHEKKRSMQFELGELIKMRSRYGLAGDFDPDWAPLPFGMSSLDPPPPPLEVPPSPPKPAWRSVRQRNPSGKKQPSQPPKPPPMRPADPPPEARPVWRLPTVGTRSRPTKKEAPPPPAPKPPALEETTAPPKPAWRNVLRRYRKTEKVRSDSIVSRSGSQETLPEETAWATWKADDTIKFTPPAGKHIKLGPPPPPPPVGLFGSTTTHSSQYPRLRQV